LAGRAGASPDNIPAAANRGELLRRATGGLPGADRATSSADHLRRRVRDLGARRGDGAAAESLSIGADDQLYFAEATLVQESDQAPPMLIQATPVRRERQLAVCAFAALAVNAIVLGVGLGVGLTAERSATAPAPTYESPSQVPSSSPSLTQRSVPRQCRLGAGKLLLPPARNLCVPGPEQVPEPGESFCGRTAVRRRTVPGDRSHIAAEQQRDFPSAWAVQGRLPGQ
jgi:hypothetical protein